VGIDETGNNPRRAAGLATELVPNVTDCAEQLQQALQQIIDPPLPMLEVRGVPKPDGVGEGALLLRTGPSPRAPHGFRNPPLVYVRRGSRSEPLGMRDIQAMLFETRTRGERIEAQRRERRAVFAELKARWDTGAFVPPHENKPLDCTSKGLAFRCSLVPTDDMNFRGLVEYVRTKPLYRPVSGDLHARAGPAFGQGQFHYRATPRPRGIALEESSSRYYARWFAGADGLIEAAGVIPSPYNGRHYAGWYVVTAAQTIAMAEWLRRLAGRPDVEFVLDGEFVNYGDAVLSSGGGFDDEYRMPEGASTFGPLSIGRFDTFDETFDFVEQEMWSALGIFRPEPSGITFAECFAKL
jgi:hypothetical protein